MLVCFLNMCVYYSHYTTVKPSFEIQLFGEEEKPESDRLIFIIDFYVFFPEHLANG